GEALTVDGQREWSTARSCSGRTNAGELEPRRGGAVIGGDQHFVVDGKVLHAGGSAQVVEPSGKDPAGVRSLAEADETAAGVVTVLGGYGRNKKRTRTGLQGVVGNVIIPGDVGGVGSAATRGQSDAVGLGTAVIPAGKTEVRIRTPGILRRVDAETVRTRCG